MRSPGLLLAAALLAAVAGGTGAAGAAQEQPPAVYTNDRVAAPALDRPDQRSIPATAAAPAYPLEKTFQLHSRPTSKRTIYLDFDGYTVAPGTWSVDMQQMPTGPYAGFSLDGAAAFSDYEKSWIQQVYRRVAEMYSPFDIDVTTQAPSPDRITRSDDLDDTFGIRVAITSSKTAADAACGMPCAGIAPIGSFDMVDPVDEYQPAWVFAANTYPDAYLNSSSLTADAIAHEVGHTFGLGHDGTSTKELYPGHGSWFPIMGQTIGSTSLGQWSKGEYGGATNPEDDLAIIAVNGAPYRTDDWGNLATPTALGTRNGTALWGVVGTDADADAFTFRRGCRGPMKVSATGIGPGQTVDLRVTLYDAAGTVLATNNPASSQAQGPYPERWFRSTGLDAAVQLTNAANATYTVRVDGVGYANPVSTGYSGYGSIGQYRLAITSCSTPLASSRKPGAPVIRRASPGAKGGRSTATARWAAPRTNGGATITRYRIQTVRVNGRGAVVSTATVTAKAAARSLSIGLPRGRYKFRVAAVNKHGAGAWSAYSKTVTAR